MAHELKHVRVYEDFLDDAAEEIRRELGERFGQRIQYFGSESEAETQVQNLTREFLAPYVQGSMNAVRAQQAKIDSPEEYFRLDRFQETCRS